MQSFGPSLCLCYYPKGVVLSLQESEQLRECLVRKFFGHEVPAGESFSSDIHRVFTPDLHHVVAPAGVSLRAPKDKQWAGHPLCSVCVGMLEIDARTSPIVLAGCVNRRRILEAAKVLVHGLGRKRVRGGILAEKTRAKIELRAVADQSLWKWSWLNQKEPVEVCSCEFPGHHRIRERHDVEDHGPADGFRMLDTHSPSHTPASIVSDNGELIEPKTAHHFDLIQGDRTLLIIDLLVALRRLAAVAVATNICRNDGELLSEAWRNLMPRGMRLRIPV